MANKKELKGGVRSSTVWDFFYHRGHYTQLLDAIYNGVLDANPDLTTKQKKDLRNIWERNVNRLRRISTSTRPGVEVRNIWEQMRNQGFGDEEIRWDVRQVEKARRKKEAIVDKFQREIDRYLEKHPEIRSIPAGAETAYMDDITTGKRMIDYRSPPTDTRTAYERGTYVSEEEQTNLMRARNPRDFAGQVPPPIDSAAYTRYIAHVEGTPAPQLDLLVSDEPMPKTYPKRIFWSRPFRRFFDEPEEVEPVPAAPAAEEMAVVENPMRHAAMRDILPQRISGRGKMGKKKGGFSIRAPAMPSVCPSACTMDMSPSGIACRQRMAQCAGRGPIGWQQPVVPARPAPIRIGLDGMLLPQPPPAAQIPCPSKGSIMCKMDMSPGSIACRARAAECSRQRLGRFGRGKRGGRAIPPNQREPIVADPAPAPEPDPVQMIIERIEFLTQTHNQIGAQLAAGFAGMPIATLRGWAQLIATIAQDYQEHILAEMPNPPNAAQMTAAQLEEMRRQTLDGFLVYAEHPEQLAEGRHMVVAAFADAVLNALEDDINTLTEELQQLGVQVLPAAEEPPDGDGQPPQPPPAGGEGLAGNGKRAKRGKCGKTRKQGCSCSTEEMHGGFLGALVGLAARAIPSIARGATTAARAATTAARGATTAASRSTAIVPYSAATAARNAAAASRAATAASSASRLSTAAARLRAAVPTSVGSTLGRVGTIASVGLPIGLSVYQAVDYENMKKQQEAAQIEADRQAALDRAANDALIAQQTDILGKQQSAAQAEYDALIAQRARDEADYARLIQQQQDELERRIAEEQSAALLAEQEFRQAMAEQQAYMQEQIRLQAEALRQQYAPRPAAPAPAPAPRPSAPAPAPRPSAPAPAPRPAAPAAPAAPAQPTAGMSAKERARLRQQGAGKKRAAPAKADGRSKRAAIVRKVMHEKGLSLPQASKYVKENKLY